MNIFEYFIERKRLNILSKELDSCNSRIRKLTYYIYNENPFSTANIKEYQLQLKQENEYRNYLKEQLKEQLKE